MNPAVVKSERSARPEARRNRPARRRRSPPARHYLHRLSSVTASTNRPILRPAVERMSAVAVLLVAGSRVRPRPVLGVRAVAPVRKQPVPGPMALCLAHHYSGLRASFFGGSWQRARVPALVSTRHRSQCPPIPVRP